MQIVEAHVEELAGAPCSFRAPWDSKPPLSVALPQMKAAWVSSLQGEVYLL